MKKLSILLTLGILSGCAGTIHTPNISSTTPIVLNGKTIGSAPPPKVPDLPANLAKRAGPLPHLTDGHEPTLVKDLAKTSSLYNDIANQLNAVLDAWGCVETSLNNNADSAKCFKEAK